MENQNKGSQASSQKSTGTKRATGTSTRSQNEDSMETSEASTESKSVGAVISQSLAKESQETIDNALGQVQTAFKSTTDYVSENTREAVVIAAAVGLSAYVLLATKPGRKIFDAGAERFIPEITKWIAQNFNAGSGVKH